MDSSSGIAPAHGVRLRPTVWLLSFFSTASFRGPRQWLDFCTAIPSEIYCVYSSEDGIPSYVGVTEWEADKRWKSTSPTLSIWLMDDYTIGCETLRAVATTLDITFFNPELRRRTRILSALLDGAVPFSFNVSKNAPAEQATETARV